MAGMTPDEIELREKYYEGFFSDKEVNRLDKIFEIRDNLVEDGK